MPPTVDYVIHRDRLGAAILHANLKVILQRGTDPRHVGDDVYSDERSSAAGPSPDSCSSCGELNAPPATTTSALACAMRVTSPHRYSTPVARRPEKRIRLASAFDTMARLGRRRAWRR